MEPILVDCKENEDVCGSYFAKTEVFINHRYGGDTPAGSWTKNCEIRSNLPNIIEELQEFVDDQSDHCIELKSTFVKVSDINTCFMCYSSGVLIRRQILKRQLLHQMFVRKLLFLVCCFFSVI